MPCLGDPLPYPPKTLQDAFDFSTDQVLPWEENYIRHAALSKQIKFDAHARQAARDDGFTVADLTEVIISGRAISKDLPGNALNRQPGINFEHNMGTDERVRVKVMWHESYIYVTMHTLGRSYNAGS